MKLLLLVLIIFSSAKVFAQDTHLSDSIIMEGKRLYRSEMASWYGTDVFVEQFKDKVDQAGGYFSYTEGDRNHCIFFSNAQEPDVLATISFDSSYKVSAASVKGNRRPFTAYEKDIYLIRKKALEVITSDTLFKSYANTNLNLVPLIDEKEKKVYVLTGPKTHGVVVIGNDYLLTFNKDNELITKKSLHRNILPLSYGEEGKEVFGTMHTHQPETGDYITATDICTLMLYQHLAKWQQHLVISENFISIWDCNTNNLAILSKEAWEKINKDQKKRNRKR